MIKYYRSPIGNIKIAGDDKAVTSLQFQNNAGKDQGTAPYLELLLDQLEQYFKGTPVNFTCPVNPIGTIFQKKVWQALKRIPYAQTCSYKAIGLSIGMKAGFQSIGQANGANPIAIIIPCHRVIGSNGALTGYASGINKKRYLLNLEYGHEAF